MRFRENDFINNTYLQVIEEARKKKPSAGLTKAQKSAVAKKARAGKDIGKKGPGFEKVAKAAGGGEKGKKIAAAAMWKSVKRESIELSIDDMRKLVAESEGLSREAVALWSDVDVCDYIAENYTFSEDGMPEATVAADAYNQLADSLSTKQFSVKKGDATSNKMSITTADGRSVVVQVLGFEYKL